MAEAVRSPSRLLLGETRMVTVPTAQRAGQNQLLLPPSLAVLVLLSLQAPPSPLSESLVSTRTTSASTLAWSPKRSACERQLSPCATA